MYDILDKFCDIFPNIDFNINRREIKQQLSIETVSTGEREIQRMLNEARRDLSKIRKMHKKGKVSSEEVFDHEFRVHELEEHLNKFKDYTEGDDDQLSLD